ncbi:MAG: hypothetical protein NTV33_12105 [Coprothermobacterota bacterium]|nr:hypothetical protein [Coprothermobacterota bacterium]
MRAGDLCGASSITVKQERELFTRLARGWLIDQVRRGLYLGPLRLPLGKMVTPFAQGLPVGSNLKPADEVTFGLTLQRRREVSVCRQYTYSLLMLTVSIV